MSGAEAKAPLLFYSDAPAVRVEDSTGKVWPLDGMHRVDILVKSSGGGRGVAFEVKLGLDRLTSAQVRQRFQNNCNFSRHRTPRLNGNMIAILERRFPFEHKRLICGIDGDIELARNWCLVVRHRVWQRSGQQLADQLTYGKLLIFEKLVEFFGGEEAFDSLILELVGRGFYRRWGLRKLAD